MLGTKDGKELGSIDGAIDGNTLGTDDLVTLGISLCTIDGDVDNNALGANDGFIVGVALETREGKEDGFSLGDAVHISHVSLQVYNIPGASHRSDTWELPAHSQSFQSLLPFHSILNSNVES